LCDAEVLLKEIVDPFCTIFGDHFTDEFINNLAREKLDSFKQAHKECTFTP